ncbi:MAG: ABC transporter ATP-binding protein [Candidatus Odinarchaeota archaeon]
MGPNGTFLEINSVTKIFESGLVRTTRHTAVDQVSFNMQRRDILALVGESGSGKTTIAKLILRLISLTAGKILLAGKDIYSYNSLRDYYKHVQVIFQDPYSSFNYIYTIDRVLDLAFNLRGEKIPVKEKKREINDTLAKIGINADEVTGRYPHQLSGGQLQRFLLARILIIKPGLLIADEPTSMIDASSRAGILNLLKDLREDEGLSILFITHDIGQAQYIADNVCIMKEGKVVEQGRSKEVFTNPKHPYSQNLLASVPSIYRKWDLESNSGAI